jgi:hypothetical protein
LKLLAPPTTLGSDGSSEPEIEEPEIRRGSGNTVRKRRLTFVAASLPCSGVRLPEPSGGSDLFEEARAVFLDRVIDAAIRRASRKSLPLTQEEKPASAWWQQERLQSIVRASQGLLEERVREVAAKGRSIDHTDVCLTSHRGESPSNPAASVLTRFDH